MAKPEKIAQEELKQPDAFQRAGADAQDWLVQRQRLVAIGVGVVLVGGLGTALFSYSSSKSETQAAQALGAALEVLDRPVAPPAEAEQPPPPAAPGEPAPFKTAKEQDDALVKALTDFRAAHKGTRSAAAAALPLGKAEYRLGNNDGAIAAFSEFLKGAAQNDPLRASALEGQGYAYEAQQKYDPALAAFDEMTKVNSGGFLVGMGQYHRARILILQGKKDDAAAVLAKIPVEHASSSAARLSTERLALLAAEGIKVPTPAPPTDAVQDAG
ncbi:tetratricopeptide repeat protein [Stigmatella sp. ncwal1]|uniref:Tetratricopeptide repeat protein n=1 Tax=Stigmatella ashevillensis TaxID=2995309 RepID=A0ABT5D1Q4_9BACT|nr:tetratricopeptide repeat protein [Stigmatella ashevillena]MDC0707594.1 tetratricopeptide repeat protein [Stigmatella ashevillena]